MRFCPDCLASSTLSGQGVVIVARHRIDDENEAACQWLPFTPPLTAGYVHSSSVLWEPEVGDCLRPPGAPSIRQIPVGQYVPLLEFNQSGGVQKDLHRQDDRLRMDRPGGDQLMEYIRPGDVLVVAELSRMTRSLMHLLGTAQALECKQVNLVSLRENINTSTAAGRCFLSMMGAIHQMERELRAERAAAGRASAEGARKDRGTATHRHRQTARRQSALRQLRQDGGGGLQGRRRRQTHLLRLPRSTERSSLSSSHGQLDLFEGMGKNSQHRSLDSRSRHRRRASPPAGLKIREAEQIGPGRPVDLVSRRTLHKVDRNAELRRP